jgi:RNA polymerase sigma factor (sigma-70 family)
MEKTYLPALTVEQAQEMAEKTIIGYGLHGAAADDCLGEMMLAYVKASAKATEGEAVRSYQWSAMQHAAWDFIKKETRRARQENVSLSNTLRGGDEGDSATVADTIAAREDDSLSSALGISAETLWLAVGNLGNRESAVITLRYFQGQTLAEVGQALGVTVAYVHQIEKRALEALAKKLSREMIAA